MVIRNRMVEAVIRSKYSKASLESVLKILEHNNTLVFPQFRNGLFSAATVDRHSEYTGYKASWVRDNIHIAHAHYVNGNKEVASKVAISLCNYFATQKSHFEAIVQKPTLASDPMARPHVRFDGERLRELPDKWPHAQNDALGYFLWFFTKLAREGVLGLDKFQAQILSLFPRYFKSIEYWQDEDSGHWEEGRKISASSIGVVLAGLKELRAYLKMDRCPVIMRSMISQESLDELILQGERALYGILPSECNQSNPAKNRRYDAALLFLVYPVQVVKGDVARTIVQDVVENLQGEYGIKRYLGDSFWCTDYKRLLPPTERTIDFSENLEARNSLLVNGNEAQWCIFDPIISVYHGLHYRETAKEEFLAKQVEYLNRSLGQITSEDCAFGGFKCPELYHVEKGELEPSDATPLLWTQANLWVALKMLENNLELSFP